MDSSLASRKELAQELGYIGDSSDSANDECLAPKAGVEKTRRELVSAVLKIGIHGYHVAQQPFANPNGIQSSSPKLARSGYLGNPPP